MQATDCPTCHGEREIPIRQEDDTWQICPDCCVHWFILPESNGPVSVGVCRYCQATREFSNSSEGNTFKVMGKLALQKKNRKDGGDHHPRGDRVLEPRGE